MNLKQVIIGIIVVVVVFGLLALAGSSSSGRGGGATSRGKPDCKVTISAMDITAVMLNYIKVTNEDTGESIYVFYNDLPVSFNFVKGDVLSFHVTAKPGYTLNGWIFDDGTFSDQNPLQRKTSGSFSMDIWLMPAAQILTP